MRPPTLSLKKRTLPPTTTVYERHPNKAPVARSLRRVPRPITPNLFFPILPTGNESIEDPTKEGEVLMNEKAPLAMVSSPQPSERCSPNLVPSHSESGLLSCSSFSTSTSCSKKKQRRIQIQPSKSVSPFSSSSSSFHVCPKNHEISKPHLMLDSDFGSNDVTGYTTPNDNTNRLKTTDSIVEEVPHTPVLSPSTTEKTIDPVSVIRRRLSGSVFLEESYEDETRRGNKGKTMVVSEPLMMPSVDDLLDDYTTPPRVAKPTLLPTFRMRRSIKRCLEF